MSVIILWLQDVTPNKKELECPREMADSKSGSGKVQGQPDTAGHRQQGRGHVHRTLGQPEGASEGQSWENVSLENNDDYG